MIGVLLVFIRRYPVPARVTGTGAPGGSRGSSDARRTTMRETIGLLYGVFKLRIGMSIALCAVAGMAASPGEGPGMAAATVLALSVLLASASAHVRLRRQKELAGRLRKRDRALVATFADDVFAGRPKLLLTHQRFADVDVLGDS